VQPARFLIPEGNSGLIRLAEDPSLCLYDPGHGLLQLWTCATDPYRNLDFTLHSEPPGWIGVPHFDHANKDEAESMDASDLKAVTKRAEDLGYAGFSVFEGRAWLKKVKHLTLEDLDYMGTDDSCVFYLRRETTGDVSVRLTGQPDTCMLAPTKLGASDMGMAPCVGGPSKLPNGGAWTVGMVFQLSKGEGDAKPSSTVQVTTRAPVPAANPNRLIIILNVENVDYTKLNSKLPLKTKFKNVIQENVATMAGLGRDNVAVKLGPGSVQAINTLSLPETSKSEDVRSKLQFDTLDEKVASSIRLVEGIKDVATGNITVRSHEMNGQDTGRTSILKLPLAILLVILVLLAILVAVIVVMVRKKPTPSVSTAPKAPASDKTEELREDPVPFSGDHGPTEHDALLGEATNGNEESAVPTEERPEELVGGNGEAKEEDVPVGGDGQPPAAAAAPVDDEENAEMKEALARSLQDAQHGSGD